MKRVLVFCYKCHEYSLIGPNEKCAICDNDIKVDWDDKQYEKDFRWALKAAQKARQEQVALPFCRSIPYVEFQPVVDAACQSNQEDAPSNPEESQRSQYSDNGNEGNSSTSVDDGGWDTVSRFNNDEELDLGCAPGRRIAEILREVVQLLD